MSLEPTAVQRFALRMVFYRPLNLRLWLLRLWGVRVPLAEDLTPRTLEDCERAARDSIRWLGRAILVAVATLTVYLMVFPPLLRAHLVPLVGPAFNAIAAFYERSGSTHPMAGNLAEATMTALVLLLGLALGLLMLLPYAHFVRESETRAASVLAFLGAFEGHPAADGESLGGAPFTRYAMSRTF